MLARAFWLRFLAWSAAMIAVIVADNLVFQQALGRFELRDVELAIARPLQLIIALAGFAAGVTLGARGARRRTTLSVALLVGAASLLLLGYLLPLGEALAGVPRDSAIPSWAPLRWALPAAPAAKQTPPSMIDAYFEQANLHWPVSIALLAVVLTLTGVAVGQWTGGTRDLLTKHALPWIVGLGLFGAIRLTDPIENALILGVLNRSGGSISPLFLAYLPLAVPVAVLATLLWVRYAEAAARPTPGVQP